MLKFFTRLEKTRNFVLLIFAILMVASLVFFYAPTRNNFTSNLGFSQETVASVAGETVSVADVMRQKESYSRFSQGRSFPASMLLDGLIGSRVIRVEAARLGLTASDKEVADEIREQFKPEDGQAFDQAQYEQNVISQFGSISAYEQSVRDDISSRKLEAFLTSGVTVSEQEVLNDYQRRNTKFVLNYVAVNPTELSKSITPTDAELHDYYDKNKQSYYISVPQKKIKYVFINTSKIGEKLQISDADLRAEYEKLPADKKVAGVLGQEIVLRVAKPEFDNDILAKANEIEGRLKKNGETVSEADFAEVAKGFSEDPTSAPLGGKLKGPVRENPNNKDDPYQRLLKMKPGEVTEPISFKGRYFILRRGEDVPKTFEDARKELEVSLRNRRAYTVAAELAGKVADELKQNKDPNKTAQDFASQANMSVANMVRETDYVKPGDDIPNIGVSPQFEEGISSLTNAGDVADKTPIKDGFAIPMLVDKKDPRDSTFEEVKDQIIDVVKLEKARAQVEEIAKKIATSADSASGLTSAASANGLSAKEQKDFVIGSPIGEGPTASTNEALENAIYAMKAGDVTKTPIKSGDNWYIVGVTDREEASSADFATQRTQLMEQMLARKRAQVYSDYLAETKRDMNARGQITIYKDVLAKVDAPEPGSIPPGVPSGLPQGITEEPPGLPGQPATN